MGSPYGWSARALCTSQALCGRRRGVLCGDSGLHVEPLASQGNPRRQRTWNMCATRARGSATAPVSSNNKEFPLHRCGRDWLNSSITRIATMQEPTAAAIGEVQATPPAPTSGSDVPLQGQVHTSRRPVHKLSFPNTPEHGKTVVDEPATMQAAKMPGRTPWMLSWCSA